MEKRKWLWKRKSSERSPGENESFGSISASSDRHSDEQMDALRESPNNGMQSSEVTSNLTIIDDEVKEHLRSLTEKLSAALVNVGAKEDLVKQHAKVAGEAVAGWEKAENEVAVLKQQLEVAVQQNLKLEVRVSHLDGALKECVRQLRQARDEQEQRISDAMVEKTGEWELTKTELDKRLLELQEQVEASRAEISISILEVMQKENSSLKQELESRCKDFEIIMMERDLSTQAAETASKQQLESIKKIAMLEAECRRLQAATRKSSLANDHKSVVASSSSYAESETDSHSDGGERTITLDLDAYNKKRNGYKASGSDSWSSVLISTLDNSKNEKPKSKTLATCGVEIDVMDDFLEMERLAALGDTKISILSAETGAANGESISVDNPLNAEFERSIILVIEMEKKLEKIESEKLKLERALDDSHVALSASKGMLVESEIQLEELQKELASVNEVKESLEYQLTSMEAEARTTSSCVDSLKAENEKERSIAAEFKVKSQELEMELQQTKTEIRLEELQKELAVVNEAKESLDYQLVSMEAEVKTMSSCVDSLKAENKKEISIAAEFKVKCQELEMELQQTKTEIRLEELQKELAAVNVAKESLEYQLISMEAKVKTMSSCVDSLKAENEKEISIAAEFKVKCQELEMELQQTKTETRLEELQKELAAVNEAKESLEYQLMSMEAEARTMSSCVDSLKAENENERSIAAEFKVKCQELEMELQQTKTEIRLEELQKELIAVNKAKESLEYQLVSIEAEAKTMSSCVDSLKAENEKERSIAAEFKVKCQELEMELQQTTSSNGELKLKKEDLVLAADKLAECQKTIASLGKQLQSLATLENFLIDTSDIPGVSSKALLSGNGEVYWSPYNDVIVPKDGLDTSRISLGSCSHLENGKNEESPPFSSSSTSSAKNCNGFGKFFLGGKNDIEIYQPSSTLTNEIFFMHLVKENGILRYLNVLS